MWRSHIFTVLCSGSESHPVQALTYQGTEREDELFHLFASDHVQCWEMISAKRGLLPLNVKQYIDSRMAVLDTMLTTSVVGDDLVPDLATTCFLTIRYQALVTHRSQSRRQH